MKLTLEDRTQINQLIARYCWLVDEGEGDGWADLWSSDGAFTGIPEPLHGREALRKMPGGFFGIAQGKLRHHMTNILMSTGESDGQAQVKAYSVVSDWRDGGKLLAFAKVKLTLLREMDSWKIKALHAEMMSGKAMSDNAAAAQTKTRKWMCANCGYVYDQQRGDPEGGIAQGTAWEDIPDDWRCPDCGASKSDFEMVEL